MKTESNWMKLGKTGPSSPTISAGAIWRRKSRPEKAEALKKDKKKHKTKDGRTTRTGRENRPWKWKRSAIVSFSICPFTAPRTTQPSYWISLIFFLIWFFFARAPRLIRRSVAFRLRISFSWPSHFRSAKKQTNKQTNQKQQGKQQNASVSSRQLSFVRLIGRQETKWKKNVHRPRGLGARYGEGRSHGSFA